MAVCCISFDSYIKPQHSNDDNLYVGSCISFDSYIKPQLLLDFAPPTPSCISFDSYIKPQLVEVNNVQYVVVYLLIPTSNHNCALLLLFYFKLYIF